MLTDEDDFTTRIVSGEVILTPMSGPLPPPRAGRPPASIPPPGERISQNSKDAIADAALGLLEEQVQARIVHYKADLETNPELDAITAQVVAQLRQMQQQMGSSLEHTPEQREVIQAQQERTLGGLLARLFPQGAPSLLIEKRIKLTLRQLARVFFQSELHERTRGQDGVAKTIQHGEQAIFYLLQRYQHRMQNELANFEFESEEVRERSIDLLSKLTKDMQDGFLARRSSELKRLVSQFNSVLVEFVTGQLPHAAHELAREIIQQSGCAEGKSYGYKITGDSFPRFRTTFERRLMVRLVGFAEDELVKRLADTAGPARRETIKFITDPQIFSMICGEISTGAYEFLFSEGFLDLPPEWIEAHQPSGG
jgi:hypothetical protein